MGGERDEDARHANAASRLAGRLAGWTERYRRRGPAFRLLWIAVGALIVTAGILMLVLPGPGLAVLTAGLAMLSLGFPSAQRLVQSALANIANDERREPDRRTPRDPRDRGMR